jgi:hypothetical protein
MRTQYPLAWHRSCVANMREGLEAQEQAVRQAQARLDSLRHDLTYREYQIAEAEREGRTAFDPDRYRRRLDPRLPKGPHA